MAIATRPAGARGSGPAPAIRNTGPDRSGRRGAVLLGAALALVTAFALALPAQGGEAAPGLRAAGSHVAFLDGKAPRQFYQEDGATYDSDGEYLGEHAPGDAVYGEDGDYLGTVESDSRDSSDGGSDAGRESPGILESHPRYWLLFRSESGD